MSSSGRPQDVWKSSAAGRPPAGPRANGRGGSGRWVVAAVVVVGIGGAIAGLFVYLWPDPPPVILAIPVAAYDHSDWPPNPWAEGDAGVLLARSSGEGAQTFQAQEKTAILRELNRAADASPSRPLVVYLSALGIPADGKIYLVPGGGRPDDPATWLALDEVLSPIRKAASPRLLVLDVRPATDSRSVAAGADVNAALDSTLAKLAAAGDLPFFVMTANTPADGAAVLRALKCTAFGLALAQASGGAADGWNPDRQRDGRVSVRELAVYTRELTHRASVAAGYGPQVPKLHGGGADFDLFRVPRDGPSPLPTLLEPEAYPDSLMQAWKDRDEWVANGLQLRAPRLTHHLTLASQRAERRLLSGGNADAIKATLDATLSRLRDVRATLVPVLQPAGSVARALRKPGLNVAAATDAMRPVFNRINEPPSPERDKALTDAMKPVWEKPPDVEPFDATAAAVFAFAQNLERPTHDQIKHLTTLLAGLKPRPPRHAELLTLQHIAGLSPDLVNRWPAGTVATLVRVARAGEEAVACEGRALPWIRGELEKADAARRKAFRELMNLRATEKVKVEAVAALEAVAGVYRTVRAATVALGTAGSEYEETRAVLIDLAVAYPSDVSPIFKVASKAWDAVAEDFLRVQTMLRPPSDPRLPDVGELDRASQSLRAGREQLRAALRVPDVGTVRDFETLLRWPHWTQPDRAKLLARLADADRAAARKALDGWPVEHSGRDDGGSPNESGRVAATSVRDLRRQATVLRIAGLPEATELLGEIDRLGATPAPQSVVELGRKVRVATRRRLTETYTAADTARQAALGWIVDPDDVPAFPQPGSGGPPNPEPAENRRVEKEFHEWLASSRYAADAAALAASDLAALRAVAAGYIDIARAYADAYR